MGVALQALCITRREVAGMICAPKSAEEDREETDRCPLERNSLAIIRTWEVHLVTAALCMTESRKGTCV